MSLGVHGCVTLGVGRGLFCSEELQGGLGTELWGSVLHGNMERGRRLELLPLSESLGGEGASC